MRIGLIITAIIIGLAGGYLWWRNTPASISPEITELNEELTPLSVTESPVESEVTKISEQINDDVIPAEFTNLRQLRIEQVELLASVADTPATRQQGLSNTAELPEGLVKLFIFDTSDTWGIWMKDMNYPLDLFWVNDTWQVVHIEEAVDPTTYPIVFEPTMPARYVIEAQSGFASKYNIVLGSQVQLLD